jgi:hypothetical protein
VTWKIFQVVPNLNFFRLGVIVDQNNYLVSATHNMKGESVNHTLSHKSVSRRDPESGFECSVFASIQDGLIAIIITVANEA